MPEIAYIALGGNIGDRRDYLDRALAALQEARGVEVTLTSHSAKGLTRTDIELAQDMDRFAAGIANQE